MDTLASIKPIKVVGIRIKLEVRLYEAQAKPATSVTIPPPITPGTLVCDLEIACWTLTDWLCPDDSEVVHGVNNDVESLTISSRVADCVQITHVHVLVELSTVDDLPGYLDVVVVKVLLDLILVDGLDD